MAMLASRKGPPIMAPVLKNILSMTHPRTLILLGHESKWGDSPCVSIVPLQRVLSYPTFHHPSIMLTAPFKDGATPKYSDLFATLAVPMFVSVEFLSGSINQLHDESAIYLGQPATLVGGMPRSNKLCNVYIFPIRGRVPAMVLADGFCSEHLYLEIANKTEKLLQIIA